jgi:hypothetical protein
MVDLEGLIGQLAFPIIVSLWFMFRTDKIIQANTETTEKLNLTLEKLFFQEQKK